MITVPDSGLRNYADNGLQSVEFEANINALLSAKQKIIRTISKCDSTISKWPKANSVPNSPHSLMSPKANHPKSHPQLKTNLFPVFCSPIHTFLSSRSRLATLSSLSLGCFVPRNDLAHNNVIITKSLHTTHPSIHCHCEAPAEATPSTFTSTFTG